MIWAYNLLGENSGKAPEMGQIVGESTPSHDLKKLLPSSLNVDAMFGPPTTMLGHEVDAEIKSCLKIGEAEIYKDPRSLIVSLYYHPSFKLSNGHFL